MRVPSFILNVWISSLVSVHGFSNPSLNQQQRVVTLSMAPGGWGIGPSKEIQDAEFAKRGGSARSYEGYNMEDSSTFAQRVRTERQGIKSKKASEMLAIAKMAGLGEKKKEKRLDKFDFDPDDDEEDIDVRVQWEEDEKTS